MYQLVPPLAVLQAFGNAKHSMALGQDALSAQPPAAHLQWQRDAEIRAAAPRGASRAEWMRRRTFIRASSHQASFWTSMGERVVAGGGVCKAAVCCMLMAFSSKLLRWASVTCGRTFVRNLNDSPGAGVEIRQRPVFPWLEGTDDARSLSSVEFG